MTTTRFTTALTALATILFLAACDLRTADPTPSEPLPSPLGLALPDLRSPDAEPVRLEAGGDTVYFIVFLRTDDEPCQASVPEWNALLSEFGPRGFQLIAVTTDARPADILSAEANALGANFPIAGATEDLIAAAGGAAAIRAIPTAILFGRDGQFANAYPGFVPWDVQRADIEAALDRLPLPSLVGDEDADTEDDG